jgi:hypothetical protein
MHIKQIFSKILILIWIIRSLFLEILFKIENKQKRNNEKNRSRYYSQSKTQLGFNISKVMKSIMKD